MRVWIVLAGLLLLVSSLCAENIDSTISDIAKLGSFVSSRGESYWMFNYFGGDGMMAEGTAKQLVSSACMMYILMKQGLVEYTSNSWTSRFMSVDKIGGGYGTQYQDYIISIYPSEVRDNVSVQVETEADMQNMLNEIGDYLDYHGDLCPVSMFDQD